LFTQVKSGKNNCIWVYGLLRDYDFNDVALNYQVF
jgi:hypothetical protein